MARSRSFGSAAEDYERYRPGYGPEVVDALRASIAAPVGTAIEIGAGTGKATRAMTEIAASITATEPDAAMLSVLERTCAGLPVQPLCAAYEDLDPELLGRFDLLYAAAAFHWTRPERRWDRAAALVRPGGQLAFFGGPLEPADPDVAATERRVFAEVAGEPDPPGPISTTSMQWPGDELLLDVRFTDVTQELIQRSLALSRDDYLGHLNTLSAYRMLSAADRSTVLTRLDRQLPAEIVLDGSLVLHTARRTDEAGSPSPPQV